MGYAGFFTVVVWLKAFLWAFKPTDIVDIRRYPKAEAIAIEKEIALLKGSRRRLDLRGPGPGESLSRRLKAENKANPALSWHSASVFSLAPASYLAGLL
jgi:hypothetical protein